MTKGKQNFIFYSPIIQRDFFYFNSVKYAVLCAREFSTFEFKAKRDEISYIFEHLQV